METRKQRGDYDGKIAGLYDLEDTIGRGHFAVVKLARHVFTGEKVAVKVIDKTKLDDVSRSHLFQEVRCMKLVQHPNVVRLYEVIDTQTKLYLILELGDGGDMYDYIMKHDGGLEENIARRYFRQIVEAISYCHQLHVVHRDLKPENVVFFEKLGIVKLTDFGFSNMFNPGKKLDTSCGSLAYSAPEILLGDSYDAPAVDVWSLGVILFMLVCGEAPFLEANDSETLTMIMDCKFKLPDRLTESCKDLIKGMLKRDPSGRLTLDAILHHPWVCAGGEYSPMAYMPLISHEHLTQEDHSYVVQRMVEGKIASKDEIISSLEKGSYDHITATYYLLAERKLKRHQQESQIAAGQVRKHSGHGQKPHLEPLSLSPRVQGESSQQKEGGKLTYVQSLVSPPGHHPTPSQSSKRSSPDKLVRKCSLIHEESQDDSPEDASDMEVDDVSLMKPVQSYASLEQLVTHAQEADIQASQPGIPVISVKSAPLTPGKDTNGGGGATRWPLKSVNSSPQLLNQICEENESDEEEDFVPSKLHSPRTFSSMASPEILRKYEQRKKRRGAGQRGTSCSSSDASDTDDTEGRSRKDKLKHKFVHRRDSSDHSSDTDGPGGPGSNIGGGARYSGGGGGSSKSGNGGSQKDSGRKDNSGGKGGGNRGSGSSKGHSKQNSAGTNTQKVELNMKGLNQKLHELSLSSLSSSCGSVPAQWSIGNSPIQYIGHTDSEYYMEGKTLQFSELSEFSESDMSPDCVLIHPNGERFPCCKVTTDINSNGIPSNYCKPGVSPVISVESKCCSVI